MLDSHSALQQCDKYVGTFDAHNLHQSMFMFHLSISMISLENILLMRVHTSSELFRNCIKNFNGLYLTHVRRGEGKLFQKTVSRFV